MSKRAKAAALSLTLGALCQVQAQASSQPDTASDIVLSSAGSTLVSQAQQQSSVPTGFSASQSSQSHVSYPGKMPETWETNPNGIGGFVQTPPKSAAPATAPAPVAPAAATTAAPPTKGGKPGKGGATASTQKAAASATYTVAELGKPGNVSKSTGWQRFENYITLSKPGQEQLPLTLTVHNGDDSPPYSQLRLLLSGRPIASEKNFKDHVLTMSVGNALGAGDNQFVIQALGPVGAKLTWRVTALRPGTKSINPGQASAGQVVTISGENFSPVASLDQVLIGGQAATVTQATASALTVTVPTGVASGEQPVVVRVAGKETKPPLLKLVLAGAPEVSGVDMISSNPGQPLTISGKGFSKVASENQVTIGGVQAQITSSSTTSISCIIPEGVGNPSYNNPVVVTTNKVASKGSVTIDIQRRVINDDTGPALYK